MGVSGQSEAPLVLLLATLCWIVLLTNKMTLTKGQIVCNVCPHQ